MGGGKLGIGGGLDGCRAAPFGGGGVDKTGVLIGELQDDSGNTGVLGVGDEAGESA